MFFSPFLVDWLYDPPNPAIFNPEMPGGTLENLKS
jgi:hypothetical protein